MGCIELPDLTEAFREALGSGVVVDAVQLALHRYRTRGAGGDIETQDWNWGSTQKVFGGGAAAAAVGPAATLVAVETGVDQEFTLWVQGQGGGQSSPTSAQPVTAPLQFTILMMVGEVIFQIGPFNGPQQRTPFSFVARSVWVTATYSALNNQSVLASAAMARGTFQHFGGDIAVYRPAPAGGEAGALVTAGSGKLLEASAVVKTMSTDPNMYMLLFDLATLGALAGNTPAIARGNGMTGAGQSSSLSKALTKSVRFANGLVVAASSDPTQYVQSAGAPVLAYDIDYAIA